MKVTRPEMQPISRDPFSYVFHVISDAKMWRIEPIRLDNLERVALGNEEHMAASRLPRASPFWGRYHACSQINNLGRNKGELICQ